MIERVTRAIVGGLADLVEQRIGGGRFVAAEVLAAGGLRRVEEIVVVLLDGERPLQRRDVERVMAQTIELHGEVDAGELERDARLGEVLLH